MRKLTLFIPGLFDHNSFHQSEYISNTTALERYLRFSSSKYVGRHRFIDTLFRLFGFAELQNDHPVAAVTRLIDNADDLDGVWMRADPVHLSAERDAVVLLDTTSFSLSRRESLIFAAELQALFAKRHIKLESPTNHRWYLKLQRLPDITTVPIHEVAGRDIREYMPVGKDKILWDQLANDIQMSLYHSELNKERQQRGNFPVNGLWMWGPGSLPKAPGCIWSNVFGDEITTYGLSVLTDSAYLDLPDSMQEVVAQTNDHARVLVVISFGMQHIQYGNAEGWRDFIHYIENEWFSHVDELFRQKAFSELNLLTGQQKFVFTRFSPMKLWRRSLSSYVGKS